MIYTIDVRENGYEFKAQIIVDKLDCERVVCALFVGPRCLSVGDGSCSYAALDDAMWDALAECAQDRIAEELESTTSYKAVA